MFKVISKDTRTTSLTSRHYTINDVVSVSIFNFEHISHLVSVLEFEQVNADGADLLSVTSRIDQ